MNRYWMVCGIRAVVVSGALVAVVPLRPAAAAGEAVTGAGPLRIGWGVADLTPKERVIMSGGSRARLSAGATDPLTATALVLESDGAGGAPERVVMVSVDYGSIHDDMLERVRELAAARVPQIDGGAIILIGTHTHAAPERRTDPDLVRRLAALGIEVPLEWSWWGMDLGVKPSPVEYAEVACGRIVDAIEQAWTNRRPGGISFGLGHAVVGHNRLIAYDDGRSQMYGRADRAGFSHVEGCEDHSVGLLFTHDERGGVTGVMVNIACPAQVSEGGTHLTSDFWHETRVELRKRLGGSLHVLPQIAAAGDQSPRVLVDRRAEERMQKLTGRNRREQIAVRIADAVTSVLPVVQRHIEWNPVFAHRVEQVAVARRRVTEEEVENKARRDLDRLLAEYTRMRREIEADPKRKQKENWFKDITPVYWHMARAVRFIARYELQFSDPTMSVPVHVVRIGDAAIATNPFELYLDYGMRIRARSKAVQTFTVQLANGYYRYLPTERSVAGGAYGAIPESNEADPSGGRELVERTLAMIDALWKEK